MSDLIIDFEKFLIHKFGYNTAIILGDSLVFLAGFFIGSLFIAFLISKKMWNSQKIEHNSLEKFDIIKINNKFLINPKNSLDFFYIILLMTLSPLSSFRTYTLKSKKRTILILIIYILSGLFIFYVSHLLTNNVIMPPN